MLIIKPIIICVATLMLINLLRKFSPEYVSVVSMICGIVVFVYVIPYIKQIIDIIVRIGNKSEVLSEIIKILVRIVITAVTCEFASHLCTDGQETYLASKINFVGKIIILYMISPMLLVFLEYIIEMINLL